MSHESTTTETYSLEGLIHNQQWIRIHTIDNLEEDRLRVRTLNALPPSQRYYNEYRIVRKIITTSITQEVRCECGRWHEPMIGCLCKATGPRSLWIQE